MFFQKGFSNALSGFRRGGLWSECQTQIVSAHRHILPVPAQLLFHFIQPEIQQRAGAAALAAHQLGQVAVANAAAFEATGFLVYENPEACVQAFAGAARLGEVLREVRTGLA